MINTNSSFIEERRNLICDTLHTTGITCEQVIEGIMWKQATNGIPRPRQRNWRKSSVAITNSIRILVFFLSLSLFLPLFPFLVNRRKFFIARRARVSHSSMVQSRTGRLFTVSPMITRIEQSRPLNHTSTGRD